MKVFPVLLLISLIAIQVSGQEFETYSNGLIYSKNTMNKLGHIVDSLNLKFKYCDLDKVYYSKFQTTGHGVRLTKGAIKQARKDIRNNISFEDFVSKYPDAEVKKNILIVKFNYVNYGGKEVVEFNEIHLDGEYNHTIIKEKAFNLQPNNMKNTWLFDYTSKSKYWDESISAFYFPNHFTSTPLKPSYNRMVGYADCLIDTTSQKMKDQLEEGWVQMPKNWQKLSKQKKEKLLNEMRSTQVIGYCSMDSRPREHAVNIALLAAETANWEVFLKAHLDIMNDRFDRASDGSYAWGTRQTYIKELEELNINVPDLIFGISLRIENPAQNHYYGSIGRIGRALSETKYKDNIEQRMLSMIEDEELDDFNRVIAYFLFSNYIHYLEDNQQEEKLALLRNSVKKLPDYISAQIKISP